MAHSSAHAMPAAPYEGRRQVTARKLRNALDRLVRGAPEHPSLCGRPYRLTVATLAREAGVGRNAIYTNHRGILEALAEAGKRRAVPDALAALDKRLAEQRSVIAALQLQLRQLATENAALLRRAVEAERRAERADQRNAQMTREIDALRRPVALRPATS
jgi:signal transduction histidine kinase